jgi:ABC-type transporter Mla MlaB component
MVVVSGELDGVTATQLAPYLNRLQAGNHAIVDLWDVVECDADGIAALVEAKQRAEAASRGFAVVVDPAGPARKALEAADPGIPIFHDRHPARAAVQQAPS